MHFEWYHAAIGAGIVLLGIAAGIWLLLRQPLPTLPESPAVPLPLESIYLQFKEKELAGMNAHSRAIEDQSIEWREGMLRSGRVLKNAKVRQIILMHGTFVGSDPANVFSSLKTYFPRISRRVEKGMSQTMRGLIDHVAQDNGNFIPSYAALLEKALGADIPVKLQYWSSANHHLARLDGAIGLILKVLDDFPKKRDDRILIVGHSHARQVLALFTHLVMGTSSRSGLGFMLWNFIDEHALAPSSLRGRCAVLRGQRFDFVTLGGPVRYSWSFVPNMTVLHIVNHSGETSSVKSAWTFWNSTSGDYVQQWGMIGSDNWAMTPGERTMNRELDVLLGKGWHTRLWLKSIVRRERLGDFGRTLLIDYQTAVARKNFISGVFGHGVYTRFDVMHFQMELICKYIYSDGKKVV